jgi:shikimate kinase
MPGSGKTTVGKALSIELNLPFIDLDLRIENSTKLTINQIFVKYDEQYFRKLEREELYLACQGSSGVVSTGGGIVLSELNRVSLRSIHRVIYLKVTPKVAFERIAENSGRPLLAVSDPLAALESMYLSRDPLYSLVATHTFDVTNLPSFSVVQSICEMLKTESNSSIS